MRKRDWSPPSPTTHIKAIKLKNTWSFWLFWTCEIFRQWQIEAPKVILSVSALLLLRPMEPGSTISSQHCVFHFGRLPPPDSLLLMLGAFTLSWMLRHGQLKANVQPWPINISPRTFFSSGSHREHISPVASCPDPSASWPFSITVPSQTAIGLSIC